MAIVVHGDIAQTKGYYSKILNRTLVDQERGANTCTVWEQTLPVDGYITTHYHDYEETLTILSGTVEVTLGNERTIVEPLATIFLAARTVHSVKNVGATPVQLLAFHATATPHVHYDQGPPDPAEWE